MSYQVLARKYRPQHFSEVIGQDHVTRTLKNAIEQQRIAHGYIFSGHRGIGKTTIARILAMALNCRRHPIPAPEPCGECESCTEVRAGGAVDVIEIDAATNRGIDEIRELREAARYRPARDRYKIYILDEAHQITDAAFNALLKTLEEPPGHIIFMMATTQPEDIPQTIRSRCQHFSFHAVKFDDIVGQLRAIAAKEGIAADDDALAVLAEAGDGSMRDALSIMDQAIASCGAGVKINAALVRGLVGSVASDMFETLMRSVERGSSEEVLQLLDKLVTEGQSPAHFIRQLVRFLRNTVVAKVAGGASALLQVSSDERARVSRVAELFTEEDLTRFLQIALRTHDELGYKQEQRFHLELGILKMVHAQRLLPIEELLSQQAGSSKQSSGSSATASVTARPAPALEKPVTSVAAANQNPNPFRTAPPNQERPRTSNLEAAPAPKSRMDASASPPTASSSALSSATAVATAEVEAPSISPNRLATVEIDRLREAVINELESATPSQGMLANMLASGEWSLQGSELKIACPASPVFVDMSFGAEAKKLVDLAVMSAAGRRLKLSVIGTGANGAKHQPPANGRPSAPVGGARNRAADDPLVRYMQEKFKGEIRTIIDKRDAKKS
jgi:DNA polymerase-3 subunit gamma/tau